MRGRLYYGPLASASLRVDSRSSDDETAGTRRSASNLIRWVATMVNTVDKGLSDEVAPYGLNSSKFYLLGTGAEHAPCTAM